VPVELAWANAMSYGHDLQPIAALSDNVIADARARYESLGPLLITSVIQVRPTAVATHYRESLAIPSPRTQPIISLDDCRACRVRRDDRPGRDADLEWNGDCQNHDAAQDKDQAPRTVQASALALRMEREADTDTGTDTEQRGDVDVTVAMGD